MAFPLRGSEDAIRGFLREQGEIARRLAQGEELARGSTYALRARNAEPDFFGELARELDTPVDAEPLIDQLNRAARTRQLVNSRLDRLSPEQSQSSLGAVARSAEENLRDMRNQYIQSGLRNDAAVRDLGAAAALTALGAGLASRQGVPSGGMMQEAAVPAYLPPGAKDFAEIAPLDIGEDDILPGVEVPLPEPVLPHFAMEADEPDYTFKTDDDLLAGSARPGPDSEVYGYEPPRQSPPPENPAVLRTIQALTRAGIPAERAAGIAKGHYSMTPAEYRAVTGRGR